MGRSSEGDHVSSDEQTNSAAGETDRNGTGLFSGKSDAVEFALLGGMAIGVFAMVQGSMYLGTAVIWLVTCIGVFYVTGYRGMGVSVRNAVLVGTTVMFGGWAVLFARRSLVVGGVVVAVGLIVFMIALFVGERSATN